MTTLLTIYFIIGVIAVVVSWKYIITNPQYVIYDYTRNAKIAWSFVPFLLWPIVLYIYLTEELKKKRKDY